jgi:hypothetical protein
MGYVKTSRLMSHAGPRSAQCRGGTIKVGTLYPYEDTYKKVCIGIGQSVIAFWSYDRSPQLEIHFNESVFAIFHRDLDRHRSIRRRKSSIDV